MWSTYQTFDINCDGAIAVDELELLMSKGAMLNAQNADGLTNVLTPDSDHVKSMICKMDFNFDGVLEFHEYYDFFFPKTYSQDKLGHEIEDLDLSDE